MSDKDRIKELERVIEFIRNECDYEDNRITEAIDKIWPECKTLAIGYRQRDIPTTFGGPLGGTIINNA